MPVTLVPLPSLNFAGPLPDYTYVFAADQQPATGPWVGAFAYSLNTSSAMPRLPLDVFFSQLVANPQQFQHAGFLFLPQAPTSGTADFRTSLLAAAASFPPFGSNATLGGFVLWLDTFGSFDLATSRLLTLPGLNHGDGTCEYDLKAQAYRLFDAGGSARTVFLDASAVGPAARIKPKAGLDAIEFQLDPNRSPALSFGDSAPARPAITLSAVSIPLAGATAGCIHFTGTNAGALTDFEFGFTYAISGNFDPPDRLACPLLDATETLAKAAATGTLDTVGSTSAVRNWLQVTPAGGTMKSAYRTIWDETITLAPTNGGQFAGAAAPNASARRRLYFVPAGDFTMAVPGAALSDHRVLGGFTAVESLGFQDGDVLRFILSTEANIAANTTDAGYAFAPVADKSYGTAWAMPVKSTSAEIIYWSESARSPFFSPPGSSPKLLQHNGFAMRALPTAPAADAGFPLLPYAAVAPLPGFAGEAGALAAFEAGYVAPKRGDLIRALPAQPLDAGTPPKVALTPQGYIVSFNTAGDIVSIELGNAAGCMLKFAATDGSGRALPNDLRDVFLSPQQFIVISCNTDLIKNYCTATIAMSGWSFNFLPPDPADVAPGDYTSVLIIKAAAGRQIGNVVQGSVTALAATPAAWTGYGLFNVTGFDQVLSSWLTTYIADAKAQYASGLPGLQTFCDLVDDPYWDGFLYLRVPVAPHNFDPQLSFLLAGTDVSQLMAHHIGCAVNHVATSQAPQPPDPTSFKQDSSFFGLVHYIKPGTPPGGTPASAFVPSSVPYDFQLLVLEAVFENSALQTFSSSAIVVLNTLFGDGVLASHDGDGPAATNVIVILGKLQQNDGAPKYVFATAPGTSSTFYLSSAALDHVEIDRAVVATNGDNGTTASVTFQMSGWMATIPPPAGTTTLFDLLSYASLSFGNFGLTMTYDSNSSPTPGADKAFAVDLSAFTLTALPDKLFTGDIVDTASAAANTLYRPASLTASFPLALQSFVIGATGKSPSDMGYRALATNPSAGGASLNGEWYGLAFDLPLGGSGSLDASGLINANLLFCWDAGGAGTPSLAPFIKLSGPGGVNLSFELEGILKFGADGISLSQAVPGQSPVYVLTFASIGVTVFTRSFPPKGSTNIAIAGFGDRTLGWFGAYADPDAPPLNPTSTPSLAEHR